MRYRYRSHRRDTEEIWMRYRGEIETYEMQIGYRYGWTTYDIAIQLPPMRYRYWWDSDYHKPMWYRWNTETAIMAVMKYTLDTDSAIDFIPIFMRCPFYIDEIQMGCRWAYCTITFYSSRTAWIVYLVKESHVNEDGERDMAKMSKRLQSALFRDLD